MVLSSGENVNFGRLVDVKKQRAMDQKAERYGPVRYFFMIPFLSSFLVCSFVLSHFAISKIASSREGPQHLATFDEQGGNRQIKLSKKML